MIQKDKKTGISYCSKNIGGLRGVESVNFQQEAINRYAEQQGITIIKQYKDIGYSGMTKERPELQMMIKDLESGNRKVDYLLLYSLERLGRNVLNTYEFYFKVTKYLEEGVLFTDQSKSRDEVFGPFKEFRSIVAGLVVE